MAKSKRWSMKDINTIKKIIKESTTKGHNESEALGIAAEHFGVTRNAVTLRWRRFLNGKSTKTLKRNTTKVSMKRGHYRKKGTLTSGKVSPNEMILKIRNLRLDLKKGVIIVSY